MEYLSSETAWEMINARNEEIKTLTAERDKLKNALEHINSGTIHNLGSAIIVAREALKDSA